MDERETSFYCRHLSFKKFSETFKIENAATIRKQMRQFFFFFILRVSLKIGQKYIFRRKILLLLVHVFLSYNEKIINLVTNSTKILVQYTPQRKELTQSI